MLKLPGRTQFHTVDRRTGNMTVGNKSENYFVCSCTDKHTEAQRMTGSQKSKNTLWFN